MALEHFVHSVCNDYQQHGLPTAARSATRQLYNAGLRRADRLADPGVPVWKREWDVLLVLDACRTDLLQSVAPDYDWLPDPDDIGTHRSVAGYSKEWMERTFDSEAYPGELARTAYVSGNPWTAGALDDMTADTLAHLDEPWADRWDEDQGTIQPDAVTDRGIAAWRTRDQFGADRLVLHYMQPHIPFIHPDAPDLHAGFEPLTLGTGKPKGPKDLWARVRDGDVGRNAAWEAYELNLRYVLDHLDETLRQNLDAKRVIVTADHGNAVGEWGCWGHGEWPLDCVKEVPWVPIETTDAGTHQPAPGDGTDRQTMDDGVEDRLQDLGYL